MEISNVRHVAKRIHKEMLSQRICNYEIKTIELYFIRLYLYVHYDYEIVHEKKRKKKSLFI